MSEELERLVDYWKETSIKGERFHSDDAAIIAREGLHLPDGRLPEPWFGVPSKAKIFYLTSCPGHKEHGHSNKEPWRTFCRDMMRERVSYERYRQEAPPDAVQWFESIHGGFANVTFPWICNLRLIAYPAEGIGDHRDIGRNPRLLPSSQVMMRLVHEHLVPRAKTGEILLLAMQSPVLWGFEKKNNYWENGFFLSRPGRRRSYITPASCVGSKIEEKLREFGAM